MSSSDLSAYMDFAKYNKPSLLIVSKYNAHRLFIYLFTHILTAFDDLTFSIDLIHLACISL